MQIRGGKAGGALRLSLPRESSVVIPRSPSARLSRGLKLNTGQWLLRFSVLREAPMTSAISIPFQKAKKLQAFYEGFRSVLCFFQVHTERPITATPKITDIKRTS